DLSDFFPKSLVSPITTVAVRPDASVPTKPSSNVRTASKSTLQAANVRRLLFPVKQPPLNLTSNLNQRFSSGHCGGATVVSSVTEVKRTPACDPSIQANIETDASHVRHRIRVLALRASTCSAVTTSAMSLVDALSVIARVGPTSKLHCSCSKLCVLIG